MSAGRPPTLLDRACPGAVRLARPADSVAGVRPSFVAAPASTQQAAAVLRAAAALDLAAVPRGTGTRLHWGSPPQRCDLVIDTSRLDRVTEHAAGDLVATVQAGVRLDSLAGVLAAAGQRLALDPPGGTVGGVLATGAAGPLRLRYGTPRDLVIGMTVVRADGVIARSGGKVVKNVAGYDLGKLFTGSFGTLGLITEATFRLHPVPECRAFVTASYPDPAGACRALAATAAESALAPVAAELDWPARGGPVMVGLALEGDSASVPERADRLAAVLGSGDGTRAAGTRPGGPASAEPDAGAWRASGIRVSAEPPSWWGADAGSGRRGMLMQLACWPGDLAGVLAVVASGSLQAGLDPAVRGSAAGVLQLALGAGADPAAVASLLAGLRARLAGDGQPAGRDAGAARHGGAARPAGAARHAPSAPGSGSGSGHGARPRARGSAVVLSAPPGVRDLIDSWGPVSSPGLMQAVKDQLDPRHLMAPGRFAGGI